MKNKGKALFNPLSPPYMRPPILFSSLAEKVKPHSILAFSLNRCDREAHLDLAVPR